MPEQVRDYFLELDHALEKLSEHGEKSVTNLPDWALIPREINVGITPDGKGIVFKVIPNESL